MRKEVGEDFFYAIWKSSFTKHPFTEHEQWLPRAGSLVHADVWESWTKESPGEEPSPDLQSNPTASDDLTLAAPSSVVPDYNKSTLRHISFKCTSYLCRCHTTLAIFSSRLPRVLSLKSPCHVIQRGAPIFLEVAAIVAKDLGLWTYNTRASWHFQASLNPQNVTLSYFSQSTDIP